MGRIWLLLTHKFDCTGECHQLDSWWCIRHSKDQHQRLRHFPCNIRFYDKWSIQARAWVYFSFFTLKYSTQIKTPLLNCITYATDWRANAICVCFTWIKPNGTIPRRRRLDLVRVHFGPFKIHLTRSRSPPVTFDDDFFIRVTIVFAPRVVIALIQPCLIAETIQLVQPHFTRSDLIPWAANICN